MNQIGLVIGIGLLIASSIGCSEQRAASRSEAKKEAHKLLGKLPSAKLRQTVSIEHGKTQYPSISVAFDQNGNALAASKLGKNLKVWQVATGRNLATIEHTSGVQSVDFSPDGMTLATGSSDETIKIWNVATGSSTFTLQKPTGDKKRISTPTFVAFSPDGRLLAGNTRKTVKVWGSANGRIIASFKGHTEAVTGLAHSSDGKLLASKSFDNTIRIWEIASSRNIVTIKHGRSVLAMAFNPDNKILATAGLGKDKSIKLWEVATGKNLSTFNGHRDTVSAIAFSPNGKILASGSNDKTIRLWDVASGKEIAIIKQAVNTLGVTSVAFSPDGKVLASGGNDRTIKLWDIRH